MSWTEHLTEDLRLVILRILSEAPGHRANSSIIQTAANALGHHVTRAQVEQQIGYLGDLAAVTTDKVGAVLVVTLGQPGDDHLRRLGTPLPGVKLPSLG
ncbi:VpaChn25_0724 family phage protein [Azospirillum picis]|uniref:ArsR family transcriptional regulator n=1 Tax=Azospirillum picis TaxID=488438 RepID=A0ABU0MPQ7_9PROT|nr:hypothetical protein [Azospirillum picis]MBP2301295.1 hypothetical protein [Azospirillum picis]MDQ0535126.1 hypothetical protein [Azospirillum picis]